MSENYFYSSLSAQEIEDTLVGAVVYNSDQSLTTSQKAQARANIGAGENDTKVIIEGFYDTLADLQSQIPVGTAGDVYAVGTESPYDIYIWDATHTEWKDNGPLSFSDAIIDDDDISLSSTWSSQKINTQISSIDLTSLISDSATAANKTWSSNKIASELSGKATPSDVATAVAALVDDSTTSASKTWSSQKIASEIDKCKWKTVWTNPNPTGQFAAQTVTFDGSYTEYLIYFKQSSGISGDEDNAYVYARAGNNGVKMFAMYNSRTNRYVSLTSNSATFSGGLSAARNADMSTDNSASFPLAIYAR